MVNVEISNSERDQKVIGIKLPIHFLHLPFPVFLISIFFNPMPVILFR